jgi:extradiol dioxygenase family protein
MRTSSPVPHLAQRAGERRRAGATMFFLDPGGNALEFKACADPSRLFAK